MRDREQGAKEVMRKATVRKTGRVKGRDEASNVAGSVPQGTKIEEGNIFWQFQI